MIEAYEVRLKDLPHNIKALFIGEAQEMLRELDMNWLEVCLLPAPDPQHEGHRVRGVANRNPIRFRHYFGDYSTRKGRSTKEWYGMRGDIRKRVVKALERISVANDRLMHPLDYRFKLHGIMRGLICKRFRDGYLSCEGNFIEPNADAVKFLD